MPAAVPLAIAGSSLVSGALGSKASKDAAKTQASAADKALALNERIYEEQKASMQPFSQGGQAAFADVLNAWQSKQRGQAPQYGPMGNPSQPGGIGLEAPSSPFSQAMNVNAGAMGRAPQMVNPGPMAQPGMSADIQQRSAYGGSAPMNTGPYGSTAMQGASVMMRAPTGETQQVPAHLVAQAEAKGAQRVN